MTGGGEGPDFRDEQKKQGGGEGPDFRDEQKKHSCSLHGPFKLNIQFVELL